MRPALRALATATAVLAQGAGAWPSPARAQPVLPPPPPPSLPPPAAPSGEPPPPPAAPAPTAGRVVPPPSIEITTLRLLHQRGLLSDAELRSITGDVAASTGARAEDALTVVFGRWSTTLYGFLKWDAAYDSTQSFGDDPGGANVERPAGHPLPPPDAATTYRGDHGRTTFSVRDSRVGLRFRAPEVSDVRVGAGLEIDLRGAAGGEAAAAEVFASPALRVRHAFARVETPVVDVLCGQYWHLFGWQNVYHPAMVQAQGAVGHLFGWAPQLRVSRAFAGRDLTFEVAAAALRPPQRGAVVPDLQGGARLAVNRLTGVSTSGATGTAVQPLSIAATADLRRLALPELSAAPKDQVTLSTTSFALDAFVPVIPARSEKTGNALSLLGELVYGEGIADLYTGFTAGFQLPALANRATYPQDVGDGMVAFALDGTVHAVRWTTFLVGARYSLPGLGGRVWVAANVSRAQSPNVADFTRPVESVAPNPAQTTYVTAARVVKEKTFFDVSLFVDLVAGLRVGLEYANTTDRYVDGVRAVNHRGQLAGIFSF